MKIALFSRPRAELRIDDIDRIFSAIEKWGMDYTVNEEFAESVSTLTGRNIPATNRYGQELGEQPADTVMVCYGGDGTLLEGVHRLGGQAIPVVGINSGHLGFLALAPRSEIAEVFAAIAESRLSVEARSMLSVEGEIDGSQQRLYALNEVAVQRLGATMISVDIRIDGKHTSSTNGDGVILSTPTGSTAYSLSAGGPIIAPTCRCTVLTPLSPHNLTMRPVVVPDTSLVELHIHTRSNIASISVDNRTFEVKDGAVLRIKSAEHTILLAVPHNISFYDTLRNKMMWGVDVR
ncbi:MAG: NAD(+)/NADH kinase [Alistipes sp.]|nr:NAD(+)/NADH kinase [Alistipes sp.]